MRWVFFDIFWLIRSHTRILYLEYFLFFFSKFRDMFLSVLSEVGRDLNFVSTFFGGRFLVIINMNNCSALIRNATNVLSQTCYWNKTILNVSYRKQSATCPMSTVQLHKCCYMQLSLITVKPRSHRAPFDARRRASTRINASNQTKYAKDSERSHRTRRLAWRSVASKSNVFWFSAALTRVDATRRI